MAGGAEAIGKRAQELPDRHSNHEYCHYEGQLGSVACAERGADLSNAGSMMSIDIAVIDINSAMSAMNSRNGSGSRAAGASGWVSGECQVRYVPNRHQGEWRPAAARQASRPIQRCTDVPNATTPAAPFSTAGNNVILGGASSHFRCGSMCPLPEQTNGRRP